MQMQQNKAEHWQMARKISWDKSSQPISHLTY